MRLTRDIEYAEEDRRSVTSRTLGVAAAGNVLFVGNWHVIYSYRVHPERVAPNLLLPEDVHLTDFGPVPVGATATVPLAITNQGTAPLTLFKTSIENPAFKVEPRQARIAAGDTVTLSLTYTAAGPETESGLLELWSDDPLSPVRTGYLVANQPGLGVGKPLPETTLALVDGGQWSSFDARGQVTLLAYFATF